MDACTHKISGFTSRFEYEFRDKNRLLGLFEIITLTAGPVYDFIKRYSLSPDYLQASNDYFETRSTNADDYSSSFKTVIQSFGDYMQAIVSKFMVR